MLKIGLISKKAEVLDCKCGYTRKEPMNSGKVDRYDFCKCTVRVMKGKRGLVPESPAKSYSLGAIFIIPETKLPDLKWRR